MKYNLPEKQSTDKNNKLLESTELAVSNHCLNTLRKSNIHLFQIEYSKIFFCLILLIQELI